MTEQTPTPEPAAPAPGRTRPWVRVLLFASLALNLLIVGLVAGAILTGPRDRDRNPALRDLGFGPFVSELPRRDKAALLAALRREEGSFRQNRAALRRQFGEVLAALRADPFDAEEFERLATAQGRRIGERQDLARRLLLERIAAMSPADRAAYADALSEAFSRGPRRRDRH